MNRTAFFARSRLSRRIDEQLHRCRELARSKGLAWETVQVFTETRGRSVAPQKDRPVYRELMAAVREGRCDFIICDSVIVLTANMLELAELWGFVRSGVLRILTVDGVDTGWMNTGPR